MTKLQSLRLANHDPIIAPLLVANETARFGSDADMVRIAFPHNQPAGQILLPTEAESWIQLDFSSADHFKFPSCMSKHRL